MSESRNDTESEAEYALVEDLIQRLHSKNCMKEDNFCF